MKIQPLNVPAKYKADKNEINCFKKCLDWVNGCEINELVKNHEIIKINFRENLGDDSYVKIKDALIIKITNHFIAECRNTINIKQLHLVLDAVKKIYEVYQFPEIKDFIDEYTNNAFYRHVNQKSLKHDQPITNNYNHNYGGGIN